MVFTKVYLFLVLLWTFSYATITSRQFDTTTVGGKKVITRSFYNEKGRLLKCYTVINQEFHGLFVAWHDNGQSKDSTYYYQGILVDSSKSWYSSGAIESFHYYDSSGLISDTSIFLSETGDTTYFAVPNGSCYQLNKTTGDTTSTWTNTNGIKTGQYKRFFKTGKLKKLVTYDDTGAKNGPEMSYRENGRLEYRHDYKEGVYIRGRQYFDKMGAPKRQLEFIMDATGEVIQMLSYDFHSGKIICDIPSGTGTILHYSEDGKKIWSRYYYRGVEMRPDTKELPFAPLPKDDPLHDAMKVILQGKSKKK